MAAVLSDFTNSETSPLTLTVTNSKFDLHTDYKVTITARKSSENHITSYKLGDAEGVINGDSIAITIPYAMDLAAVKPEIARYPSSRRLPHLPRCRRAKTPTPSPLKTAKCVLIR